MMRVQTSYVGNISRELAEAFYKGFRAHVENMSYDEAKNLSPALFDEYQKIYPERCPVEKKNPAAAVQPNLLTFEIQSPKKTKCKRKSRKTEILETNQPNLFQ